MGHSVGVYRSSELAAQLAREAVRVMSVVVIGSIYTEGVTPETPAISLFDEFDFASIRAARAGPLVFVVDTEEVEPAMIRAMLPVCAPALLRLPRAIPKLFAAIKAEPVEAVEAVEAFEPDRTRLVIFDPPQGPSTTTHLMLMACDTVVVQLDGTRASLSALRLFLCLAPSWLEHYKPILRSHRPRIVVFATDPKDPSDPSDPSDIMAQNDPNDPSDIMAQNDPSGPSDPNDPNDKKGIKDIRDLAEDIASRLFPSAVVVSGTVAALLAHLRS